MLNDVTRRNIKAQIAVTRRDLPRRTVSIFVALLLSTYYLHPATTVAILAGYLGTEVIGLVIYRWLRRGVTMTNAAALLLNSVIGSVLIALIPIMIAEAGTVVGNLVAAGMLGAALIHCIMIRSTWAIYGIFTALPFLAGLLITAAGVSGTVDQRGEIAVALGVSVVIIYYIVRCVQDVSQTRSRLLSAIEAAERANAAKTRFVAAVGHEIRTPLNAIKGLADLIDEDDAPASRRYRLSLLRRSATGLGAILDDLLDHTKLESGRQSLAPRDASPRGELVAAVETFRGSAVEKALHLSVEIDASVPDQARFDPQRFGQVLGNLLSNAIKYTDAGGVTVTARADARGDGHQLTIRVTDTGRGMDAGQQHTLFSEFSRAEAVEHQAIPGTGLGLWVSRGFARLMDGDIVVASMPGTGSTFTFTARLRPALGEPKHAAPASPSARPEGAPGLSVLVVDDSAANRHVARSFLKPLTKNVAEAANGREALARLDDSAVDVILLDIQMPVMDGDAMLEELRRRGGRPAAIPVILLTGSEVDPAFVARSSVAAVLRKPLDRAALLAALERVIRVPNAA